MRASEKTNEIVKGLVQFQTKVPVISKNKEVIGKAYNFRYADLENIMTAVRGPMSEAGLCLVSSMIIREGEFYEITRLYHTSGEWFESEFPMGKNLMSLNPQDVGKLKTYGKRYNTTDLLSLAAEDDTDGPDEVKETKRAGKQDNSEANEMRALYRDINNDITSALDKGDIEVLREVWKGRSKDMTRMAGYNKTGAEQLQSRYDEAMLTLNERKN